MDEIFSCLHQYLNVQFTYQAVESHPEFTPKNVEMAHFKALPSELRSQLHDAAAQLDIEQTESVIAQIADLDAGMAKSLKQHLEQMDFQSLLDFCENLH
jgi:predicted component of type VI protein secretion system